MLRENDMDPLIHTQSGQALENSSRMEPTPSVPSSCAHWVTRPQLRCAILAANDVTLRNAGKKCRGSTGFSLGTLAGTPLPATTETFGASMKQGAKIHQSSGKHTLGHHAFQTAGQWVRGEMRNMQVAGLINNDENRPKLSSQNETEVVDQVAGLCCCAALLFWMTMTMTRSGKTIEQMQETRKRHTPMSFAVLRPRCWRQSYRAKALRIQERSPSVDVVQLELVEGVTLCLPAAKIPSLWRSFLHNVICVVARVIEKANRYEQENKNIR